MQGNFLLFSAESLIYARIPEFSFRSRELAGNFRFLGVSHQTAKAYGESGLMFSGCRELAGNFRFLGLSHQTAKTYGENGKLLSMLQGISREFLKQSG
jgi:hypothetical protein